jgi:hypothetical protein
MQFLPSITLILFTGLAYMLSRVDLLAFYLPGTYLAWVYLRFFQLQPDSGGVHGDASDDFKVWVYCLQMRILFADVRAAVCLQNG